MGAQTNRIHPLEAAGDELLGINRDSVERQERRRRSREVTLTYTDPQTSTTTELDVPDPSQALDALLTRLTMEREFAAAILSPTERAAFVLHEAFRLPDADIAFALDKSRETITRARAKALRKLRDHITKSGRSGPDK